MAKKVGGTFVLRGSEGFCRVTLGRWSAPKRFWEWAHFACGPRRGPVLHVRLVMSTVTLTIQSKFLGRTTQDATLIFCFISSIWTA